MDWYGNMRMQSSDFIFRLSYQFTTLNLLQSIIEADSSYRDDFSIQTKSKDRLVSHFTMFSKFPVAIISNWCPKCVFHWCQKNWCGRHINKSWVPNLRTIYVAGSRMKTPRYSCRNLSAFSLFPLKFKQHKKSHGGIARFSQTFKMPYKILDMEEKRAARHPLDQRIEGNYTQQSAERIIKSLGKMVTCLSQIEKYFSREISRVWKTNQEETVTDTHISRFGKPSDEQWHRTTNCLKGQITAS